MPERPPASFASLPGRMAVQWPVWVRCFPGQVAVPVIGILLCVLFFIVFLATSGSKVLGSGIVLAAIVYRLAMRLNATYSRVRRQFIGGCVNPAIVVAPDLIAVYTDLTKTSGDEWPAIKILRQPLSRAPGQPLRVGERLAAVALYQQSEPSNPHWKDFHPIAAVCVTADETDRRRLLAELDAETGEWERLERGLAQIPTKTRPGLYLLRSA